MSRLLLALALVALSLLALCHAQSISFNQVASTTAFPTREYAACTQVPPTTTTSNPTLYFFGGFSVTLNATTNNSYYDTYYNDAWSSTNFGQSWTQLNAAAAFPVQGWNGAVYTKSRGIVYIGGGGDSNLGQNNQIWTSTDGATFNLQGNGPWDPRETAGIAGQAGTDNILVALGNTKNDFGVDDIWYSSNAGQTWTVSCGNGTANTCPFVTTVVANPPAAQVHGPAAVGLTTGAWLLIGGYGSDTAGTSGNTIWVTNQVAYSTNNFVNYTVYNAPWSPRAQQRAVADVDNYVYVFGGVYNLPIGTSPTQIYYSYYTDIYYSTNPASASATWTLISQSAGLGSAGYPGVPYSGNGNSNQNSAIYTAGAVFNPCLAVQGSGSSKQLALYTGLYAGYRQNNRTGVQVAYPGVYVGSLSGITSRNGAASVGGGVAGVLIAVCVAVASLVL